MRIRFTGAVVDAAHGCAWQVGEVVELPADVARYWVAQGRAVEAEAEVEAKVEVEVAPAAAGGAEAAAAAEAEPVKGRRKRGTL